MMKKSFPFNLSGSGNENVSSIALTFRCDLLKNEIFPDHRINLLYFSATSQIFLSHHIFHIFHSY